jgi:hypothetical protein
MLEGHEAIKWSNFCSIQKNEKLTQSKLWHKIKSIANDNTPKESILPNSEISDKSNADLFVNHLSNIFKNEQYPNPDYYPLPTQVNHETIDEN